MAFIALLICLAFIVFLLSVDRQASKNVSLALWIPTLWLLIAASRPLPDWIIGSEAMRYGPYTPSSSLLEQWVLGSLALLGIAVLAKRRFEWRGILWRNRWLLVLLAYMFLSTFWSHITLIAMKRWTREVVVVIMALVVASEGVPRQALASLFRRVAYVLIPLSLLLIRYYPAYGRVYGRYDGVEMWNGVTMQKNSLGLLCMVSIFFLLLDLYQLSRKGYLTTKRLHYSADIIVTILAIYLLIGSHSATSLATCLFGVTGFAWLQFLRKRRRRVPKVALFAGVLFLTGIGLATPFLGGTNLGRLPELLGRNSTLTGRTEVWASVMPARSEKPLLGYGMGSFWTADRRNLYKIPNAHNGYLDILLDFGEVGFLLYIPWLLSCVRQLHSALRQHYDWAVFSLCLLGMGLLHSITESGLNTMSYFMTAVIIFSVLAVPQESPLQRGRIRKIRVPTDRPVLAGEPQALVHSRSLS